MPETTDISAGGSASEPPEGTSKPPLTRSFEASKRRSAELFAQLDVHGAGQATRRAARDELVHLHLTLVEHCARRFRNRGEPFEDLVQVGTIGLLKSIDCFDLERAVEFSTY